MSYLLTRGAKLMCTAGSKPTALELLTHKGVKAGKKAVAYSTDSKPLVNIKPFGNCKILSADTPFHVNLSQVRGFLKM